MSDLISRQAAIEALEKEKPTPFVNKDRRIEPFSAGQQNQWYRDGIAIMNLPSEQPERKKGKWIRENIVLTSNPPQYQWHCSECGRLVHWFSTEILTNFCPNCGADMRGENYAD